MYVLAFLFKERRSAMLALALLIGDRTRKFKKSGERNVEAAQRAEAVGFYHRDLALLFRPSITPMESNF
jgi:hypothetical protein